MRLPNTAHESRPWRIREIAPDFAVEDVWALPVHGGVDDFHMLVDLMESLDPATSGSLPLRVLWNVRDLLGKMFGLGRVSQTIDSGGAELRGSLRIPGTSETSLDGRLPEDLRHSTADPDVGSSGASARAATWAPFVPLYRTEDEFAAELSNRTVHAVLHLAWADQGGGRYQGQMAVYVKPRGQFGTAYMALIKPLRLWVVYPALMRQIERAWSMREAAQASLPAEAERMAGGVGVDLEAVGRFDVVSRLQQPGAE